MAVTFLTNDKQTLTEEEKAQARENIGAAAGDAKTTDKYFDIDYDGIISLKPEYRGCAADDTYPYAVSDNGVGVDGSKIDELPEKIVIPDVIGRTAVTGFQQGMFYYNQKVKEITIPDTVTELPTYFCRYAINLKAINNTEHITKLGENIISYTRVEKAIFPNLTEVAYQSLGGCGYMYIADIGNNITDIPERFFFQNAKLSQVKGGTSVKTIGKSAFYATYNLKNLPFLSLENVTSIEEKAFLNSRIQFDWSTLEGKCTFGNKATPVADNTVDYWTGVNFTPCENPLGTVMCQTDKRWAEELWGDTTYPYRKGCGIFATLHIHSALSGKTYSHPDEFADELRAIDPVLVTEAYRPHTPDKNIALLERMGYAVTSYGRDDTPITTATYQAVCDALSRGAYVMSQAVISSSTNDDGTHAVVLYGINDIGEVLVVNSDPASVISGSSPDGVDPSDLLYSIPYRNITASSPWIIIVEKNS